MNQLHNLRRRLDDLKMLRSVLTSTSSMVEQSQLDFQVAKALNDPGCDPTATPGTAQPPPASRASPPTPAASLTPPVQAASAVSPRTRHDGSHHAPASASCSAATSGRVPSGGATGCDGSQPTPVLHQAHGRATTATGGKCAPVPPVPISSFTSTRSSPLSPSGTLQSLVAGDVMDMSFIEEADVLRRVLSSMANQEGKGLATSSPLFTLSHAKAHGGSHAGSGLDTARAVRAVGLGQRPPQGQGPGVAVHTHAHDACDSNPTPRYSKADLDLI